MKLHRTCRNDKAAFLRFSFISILFCCFMLPVVAQDNHVPQAESSDLYLKDRISPQEFIRLQKAGTAILLDVRGRSELKHGRIENSINIPLYTLESEHHQLPKDKLIVTFCNNGTRSFFAYEILKRSGFRKLKHLNKGVRFKKSGEYDIPSSQ